MGKKLDDRKEQLVQKLEKKGKLSVSEIAEIYSISLPSARRLCAQLAQEHKVMRIHGGIRYVPSIQATYSFDILDSEYKDEKTAIAQYACGLVKDNQNIFLESGTTVKYFALALAGRIKQGEFANVSIFTNSLVNLEILSAVCNVTVVGGIYRPHSRDFCGFFCEKMIRSLHFNTCFLGADALNINDGIMAMDIESVRYNELLVQRSDQSVILAHSGKFHKHSLISYSSVHDVSLIITDSKLLSETYREYKGAGISLVCV
jgi:DeoR/GlpR family transcriptional regulator of sugar metabolism